jgi:hypothetical protein
MGLCSCGWRKALTGCSASGVLSQQLCRGALLNVNIAAERLKSISMACSVASLQQRCHCLKCSVELLSSSALPSVCRQLPSPGSAGAVRGIALCSSSALMLVAHASGGVAVRSSEVAASKEEAAAGCPQHVLLLKVRHVSSSRIATITSCTASHLADRPQLGAVA